MRIVDFLNDQGAKFAIKAWARRPGFQTVTWTMRPKNNPVESVATSPLA